jgi:nitrous oxidase accessory protein NosD
MSPSDNAICLFGLVLAALSISANGATVTVNCDKGDKLQTTINSLGPQGPNTVLVSGTCNQPVTIQSFDRLTLQANPGARINASTTDVTDAIDIVDSNRVAVNGFTISGGNVGVFCGRHSTCALNGNTVQFTIFAGVAAYEASSLTSDNDVIQNNQFDGVLVQFDSYFETDGGTVIQNNANEGIALALNSSARIISAKILNNAGNGVRVYQNSSARIGFVGGTPSNVITGNGGNGVFIGDLSFVQFTPENNITGNLSQPDVSCHPQFSATRGTAVNIGGGTTDCVEPAPEAEPSHHR